MHLRGEPIYSTAMARVRIDKELVDRGLVESRERAQILVMAGQVYLDGHKVIKPSQLLSEGAQLEVRGQDCPYVSRGGWKLEGALEAFELSVDGRRCLDLGASTGGFTDVLLQRGARSVAAVDVGKGQLHWKLRQDPRVTVREKTNARYLQPSDFDRLFDFLTGDLSFIGLSLVLPAAFALATPQGQAVFLIKPQFEAGRHQVGRKGVVRDPEVHRQVLTRVLSADYGHGFRAAGVVVSPLKGPAGNIEYLARFERSGEAVERFHLVSSVEGALETVRREWSCD